MQRWAEVCLCVNEARLGLSGLCWSGWSDSLEQPPRVIPEDFRHPLFLVRGELGPAVQTLREVTCVPLEFGGHLVVRNPPVF